jgi:uncharacterized protein (TIGR02270 family)
VERENSLQQTVIPLVVEQHADGIAVLWLQRDRAVGEPHYRLADLTQHDDRLRAQEDGLKIAQMHGWLICLAELARWSGPGEVFSAAILAWESGSAERFQEVMNYAVVSYDCSRACVSSLGWLSEELADSWIDRLLVAKNVWQRRLGIAACAVRGRDPGEFLSEAVRSPDTMFRARALRAAGELARRDLIEAAKNALQNVDSHVRFSAAWAVARLEEDEQSLDALRKTVESQTASPLSGLTPTSDQHRALQLALRRMPPAAAGKWLNELAKQPAFIRQAVIGSGVVGVPEAIPWLFHVMQNPALSRVAGEAFTMITGLDLAAEKFDAPWPAGFTAGPTEDPDDDNVAMDEDENLPWPDAGKLADWWQKNASQFEAGTRYLCGRPLTEDWLEQVLRYGYQRQRAAAALELALRRPDQPLFNVRAPGHRQQELLGLR